MRRFLLFSLLCARAWAAEPLPLVVNFPEGLGPNGGTTYQADTSGAKSLIVPVVYYNVAPTLSDLVGGNSNTFVPLTIRNQGLLAVQLYYCVSACFTGPGHTFTLTGAGSFSSLSVYALPVAATFQAENGDHSAGTTVSTGAVTGTGESIAFTAVASGAGSPFVDSYFALASLLPNVNGRCVGIATAARYLPAGGTVNPQWTVGFAGTAAAIAAFGVPNSLRSNALSSNPWPPSPLWTPEQLGPGIVTQRFDASTLGLANGDPVNSWPDSSGNGFTATPANAGACVGGSPTYQTPVQNGLGIVRTSGTQCFTSAYVGTNTAGVFTVTDLNSGGATIAIGGQDTSDAGTDVRGWSLFGTYAAGVEGFCRGVSGETLGVCSEMFAQTSLYTSAAPSHFYALVSGDVLGHSSSYGLNQLFVPGGLATSATAQRTLSAFTLGAEYRSHALANPGGIDLAEFITTAAVTTSQRERISRYLSSKWFLAPPQTFEYAVFNGGTHLQLLTSVDAATWADSPNTYAQGWNNTYRVTIIRDPSIALINGTWWVAYTNVNPAGPNYYSFSIAKSSDRGTWQYVGEAFGACCGIVNPLTLGAPEWFVDQDGSVHVLYDMGDGGSGGVKLFEIHPTNAGMTSWSAGVALTTDDASMVDPFVLRIGATYYLFATQKDAGSSAKLLSATSLLGSYTTVRALAFANEGQSVIRLDGKWRLYWDPGSGGLTYSDCVGDLGTCVWSAPVAATMPFTAIHGTAIRNQGNPAGALALP